MKRRALTAAGILLGLCLAAAALLLIRPDCLILKYTGLYCAGCGTQHMAMALLRGDLPGAAGQNLYMLILLPVSGVYLSVELARYVLGKKPLFRSRAFIPALCAVLGAGLVFTLLRNLPGWEWLAPAWAAQ